ncbi:MAG: ABC transporter permease, partial [Microbispora sp.]|nr:ABC transporter permease [Microbispora sp.]
MCDPGRAAMNGSWRRSRPFWGGLLVLVAGLELLSIPFATQALPLIIQSGTVGATYLIALVLIILGLLIWLQPNQRVFLGVVAVLVSIASFVYANLGGFLIGMLLGLIGGALAVAWTPVESPAAAAAPEPAVPSGQPEGEITFTARRVVSGDERLEATRPQRPVAGSSGEEPSVLVARVRREPGPAADDDPDDGPGDPGPGDPGPGDAGPGDGG